MLRSVCRLPAHLIGLEVVGRMALSAAPAVGLPAIPPPLGAEAAAAPRAGRYTTWDPRSPCRSSTIKSPRRLEAVRASIESKLDRQC
jgi:hypothetical protein